MIAGVLWILYGCLVLASAAVSLVLILALAGAAGRAGGAGQDLGAAFAAGGFCGAVVIALFGIAFLFVGIQSVRGTARDTLGNGIGSVIFSVLQFGWAALAVSMSAGQIGNIVQAGVAVVTGALLLTAGVLALVARGAYRDWKRAQWTQRQREAAERRERRRFYR
ncbi:MAG TPA: hypothetical protein VMS17_25810 [Gemmataceae bacterium]|nr:hypothetical protein [Gemmataceae bacterium]